MKILLLNQCFYPDVVSTAQHLTDLAVELVERGNSVTVVTSDRGYDNGGMKFKGAERWRDIQIIRIPSLSLGKSSKLRRTLNFGSFLTCCALRLLTLGRFDVVVALTSPPLISFLGALFVKLRGGRFCFWVMDLNPDEAIAAGWLKPDSLIAKLFQRMLIFSLKTASRAVVLDRFMKDRILAKGIAPEKVLVVPPWSHDHTVSYNEAGRKQFRAAHHLSESFVVMYSGNHSPCHPLDTLLSAAQELASHREIKFVFAGGGSEKAKVREFASEMNLNNIVCLPYEPLDTLSHSLSAADLHVVVMGNNFVGVVHPCKIYNIMTIGAPSLYIGPAQSHVTDIARANEKHQFFLAKHGDTASVVNSILSLYKSGARSRTNRTEVPHAFAKSQVLPRIVHAIEQDGFNSATISESVAPDPV
ncbi:MAG TPA: glycosyltransferase family 4 protein [Pyrinomonadaceae bacterium]|nr:glycosyltransferase family 4 protein [Pyrinomonadaceae bacterium]